MSTNLNEFEPDRACEEADGCPTEGAVLKRFWRAHQPDKVLCDFYEVTDYPSLVHELVGHVAQLQDLARRNVKPWEDTMPPTLLPAHIERVKAADEELRAILAQAEMWNPHPDEAHLASLLIVLGSAGIKVSGGTHGDPWTVAAPVVERQDDALSKGFYATQTGGGKYEINIGYRTIDELHAADQQLRDLLKSRAEQPAPVASENLRNFANSMIDIALEGCDADGAQIQELAVEHGLLKPEQRTERCGDTCSCAEYADFPVECFRKVDELNKSRAS